MQKLFKRGTPVYKSSVQKTSHIWTFSEMADSPRVALHIRRKFNNEMSSVWHCRYIGVPVPDKVPAVCRTSIDSIVHCADMMEFSKSMGLRMEYEYVAKGFLFTKGPIKILVYKVYSTEKPGVYSKDLLKPQLDSHVVEAMIPVENEDTLKYSKILKDFCDQLAPLVEFKKVEYFKPKLNG